MRARRRAHGLAAYFDCSKASGAGHYSALLMRTHARPTFGGPVALAAASLALAACGDDDDATTTTTTSTPSAARSCEKVEASEPERVRLKPPDEKVDRGEDLTATVETNCGDFEIKLNTADFPKTASSFVHMVEEGLYEGTTFHRVVPNFVIQGGDPEATGSGGPGYSIREEPPVDASYTRGVVAMAKTPVEPPGTSGSQFFVVTEADAGLEPDYAVLGKVVGDEAAIDAIEAQADPSLGPEGGEPVSPVVIERIKLS
jgi:peptidyl-prolyl cis-trans isomerase B (cyclophilin B)